MLCARVFAGVAVRHGRDGARFDTTLRVWFKRHFNSNNKDVLFIGENVFVVRKGGIAKLDESIFYISLTNMGG